MVWASKLVYRKANAGVLLEGRDGIEKPHILPLEQCLPRQSLGCFP